MEGTWEGEFHIANKQTKTMPRNKNQEEKDEEMKRQIRQELGRSSSEGIPGLPSPSSSATTTQAQRDEQMKAEIRAELGRNPSSGGNKDSARPPVTSQADQDAQMKAQIQAALGRTSSSSAINQPSNCSSAADISQADDEQTKEQIRSYLGRNPSGKSRKPAPSPLPPPQYSSANTAQADQDAEMKAKLRAELGRNPPPSGSENRKPPPHQKNIDKDAQMKAQLRGELGRSRPPSSINRKPAAPSNVDEDAQMKAQLRAELGRNPPSRTTSPSTQAQNDAKMKEQLREELGRSPPSGPSNASSRDALPASSTSDRDAQMKDQLRAELSCGDPSHPSKAPDRRLATASDEQLKSQIGAELDSPSGSIDFATSGHGAQPNSDHKSSMAGEESMGVAEVAAAAAAAYGNGNGENDDKFEYDTEDRRASQISSKERPEPVEGGDRVGAVAMNTRAYGGLPAWIRNRQSGNSGGGTTNQNDDSNLPPEMRGIQPPEEEQDEGLSHLPPEMRAVEHQRPEESPPPEEAAPLRADVMPVTTDVSESKDETTSYRIWIILLAIVVVIGAVVGGVVAATGGGDNENTNVEAIASNPTMTPTPPPTQMIIPTECPNYPGINPDVDGMSDEFMRKYEELETRIVLDIFPDHTRPVTADEYCSSVHLAHVWLTKDQLRSSTLLRFTQNRFLLAYIYMYWDGYSTSLSDWLSDMTECDWGRITCDESGIIVSLDFNEVLPNNRMGDYSIPTAIGALTDIQSLVMRNNGLVGEVPSSIGNLANLELLDLGLNKRLSGTFPFDEISALKNLRVLVLNEAGPGLQTAIPPAIGELTNLEYLSIEKTKSGNLPTEIGRLTRLVGLNARFSAVGGAIPSEIGNLHSLTMLDLGYNDQLGGFVPSEIGMLTSLKWLYIPGRTQISGNLPTEIARLTGLERLIFDGSPLSGTVPSELGLCTSLDTLVLADSLIGASLPPELGLLSNLEILSFSDSFDMTGELPFDFSSLSNLAIFDVRDTSFSGSVSWDISTLSSIECIDFYGTGVEIDFIGECSTGTGKSFRYASDVNPCFCSIEEDCQCEPECTTGMERCISDLDIADKFKISDEIEKGFFKL